MLLSGLRMRSILVMVKTFMKFLLRKLKIMFKGLDLITRMYRYLYNLGHSEK